MAAIHSTAVIDPRATIAPDAVIGPYCVVGPDVVIAAGCHLVAHVHVTGHTTIGARTRIAPFASLGMPPQSVHYRGGPTRLIVGADCDIREHVTMNTGTEDGRGVTTIGDRCFAMVGAHIAHDCEVGQDVILANGVVMGGHVFIGDNAVVGGVSAIHQFVRIGEGAMVAGLSGIQHDLIPFGMAVGNRAVLNGLNVVGLKRRGFSRDEILRLRRAYRLLFLGNGVFQERVAAAEREFSDDPVVGRVLDFIRRGGRRDLAMPSRNGTSAEVDADGEA